MRLKSMPLQNENHFYFFEPITGSLLYKDGDNKKIKETKNEIPKVKRCLNCCTNPYLLQKYSPKLHSSKKHYFLIQYAKSLVWLCKYSFLLGKTFSKLGISCFDTTEEAIQFFRKCFPGAVQNDLCYPRALFAASTSKLFKEKGVVFIGVFLPSKSMHAWIIEDNKQPDIYDNMWINFQPVAAIY